MNQYNNNNNKTVRHHLSKNVKRGKVILCDTVTSPKKEPPTETTVETLTKVRGRPKTNEVRSRLLRRSYSSNLKLVSSTTHDILKFYQFFYPKFVYRKLFQCNYISFLIDYTQVSTIPVTPKRVETLPVERHGTCDVLYVLGGHPPLLEDESIGIKSHQGERTPKDTENSWGPQDRNEVNLQRVGTRSSPGEKSHETTQHLPKKIFTER